MTNTEVALSKYLKFESSLSKLVETFFVEIIMLLPKFSIRRKEHNVKKTLNL